MKLSTIASIEVEDSLLPNNSDRRTLRMIREELNETFEDVANSVLERHGIRNEEVHTVIVDDLEIEDENDTLE